MNYNLVRLIFFQLVFCNLFLNASPFPVNHGFRIGYIDTQRWGNSIDNVSLGSSTEITFGISLEKYVNRNFSWRSELDYYYTQTEIARYSVYSENSHSYLTENGLSLNLLGRQDLLKSFLSRITSWRGEMDDAIFIEGGLGINYLLRGYFTDFGTGFGEEYTKDGNRFTPHFIAGIGYKAFWCTDKQRFFEFNLRYLSGIPNNTSFSESVYETFYKVNRLEICAGINF